MKNIRSIAVCFFFTISTVMAGDHTIGIQSSDMTSAELATVEEIGLAGISKPASLEGVSRLQAAEKRFEYGAHGGVQSGFGTFRPSGYRVNSNIGFNIGVYFRIYAFKNFYVQPAVYYYYSAYDFKRSIDSKKDKVKVHSMKIPIVAGYTIVNNAKFYFRLQTGPSVGFNLKVGDNDVNVSKDTFSKTQWDWIVDAQIRIAVITLQGGFVGGMSKYLGNERVHSWYAGLGFSL